MAPARLSRHLGHPAALRELGRVVVLDAAAGERRRERSTVAGDVLPGRCPRERNTVAGDGLPGRCLGQVVVAIPARFPGRAPDSTPPVSPVRAA